MEQALEGADGVHCVSVWVSPNGETRTIPSEFSGVKITRTGWPDKRSAQYEEFVAWANTPVIEAPSVEPSTNDAAQAYAMRVWGGQSVDVPKHERIERCMNALRGQNLPTDGITFPA